MFRSQRRVFIMCGGMTEKSLNAEFYRIKADQYGSAEINQKCPGSPGHSPDLCLPARSRQGINLRIHLILINFLSNAVKYTREGGGIGLAVRELPQVVPNDSRI